MGFIVGGSGGTDRWACSKTLSKTLGVRV